MKQLSALQVAITVATACACCQMAGAASSTPLNDRAMNYRALHDSSTVLDELVADVTSSEMLSLLVQWRRHLHAHPELAFEEFNTSMYIREQLDLLNITYEYPFSSTGVSATIGSGKPVFALRADMDALPIFELVDVPWRSTIDGRMHACGHDAHVSMLLGAAKLLKAQEAVLRGTVVLVFQPAEEGRGGAKHVLQEGGLLGAEAIAGIHVAPFLASGVVATRPGPIMASSDRFTLWVAGSGGHAAMPHLAADPVVAASAIVVALQTLVSREMSPTDSGVITVTSFNTGLPSFNVIPESVELRGTVRALTAEVFDHLRRRLEQVAAHTAAAHGCDASNVTWSPLPYPPTINDRGMASLAQDVATDLTATFSARLANHAAAATGLGSGTGGEAGSGGGASSSRAISPQFYLAPEPIMAAEDFSFYGEKLPAVFSFLGTGSSERKTDVMLHNPRFQMDESQLPLGAALHASIALEYLNRWHMQNTSKWQQQQEHQLLDSKAHEEL